MNRSDVNPWEWSKGFGFSQAVKLEGAQTIVLCSGQTSVTEDGTPTGGAMADQVKTALANLSTVLDQAGMSTSDIVKLTIYTTDVDELLAAYGSISELVGGNLPAATLIGVTRLAFPELKVEIEATAVN